jgi:hypothetical protein
MGLAVTGLKATRFVTMCGRVESGLLEIYKERCLIALLFFCLVILMKMKLVKTEFLAYLMPGRKIA